MNDILLYNIKICVLIVKYFICNGGGVEFGIRPYIYTLYTQPSTFVYIKHTNITLAKEIRFCLTYNFQKYLYDKSVITLDYINNRFYLVFHTEKLNGKVIVNDRKFKSRVFLT